MISSCSINRYEARAAELDAEARQDRQEAAQHATAAVAHTGAAAVNTVVSAASVAYGTVEVVKGAAHLAAAGGLSVAAAKAWLSEKIWSGAQAVAALATRGFAALSNAFGRASGDGTRLRVKEREVPAAPQSAWLLDEAKKQLGKSGGALETAGLSYANAAVQGVSAGVNVVAAAGHTAAAAGNAMQADGRALAAARLEGAARSERACEPPPRKRDSCEGVRH